MSSRKEENEESDGFGWFGLGVATLVGAGIGALMFSGSSSSEQPHCNASSATSTGTYNQSSETYRTRSPPASEPCGICLDDVLMVVRLPCGHRFHDQCVKKWIAEKKACPTCRRKTNLTELKYSA